MNIVYYVPAVLGVLFIAVGAFNGWKMRRVIRKCTAPSKGTVIGFKNRQMKSGKLLFPVISYVAGNQKIMAQYTFGNAEWKMKRGDTIDLRYNPDDPKQIYLYHEQSVYQQYVSPFFVIVGGLLFLLAYVKLQ